MESPGVMLHAKSYDTRRCIYVHTHVVFGYKFKTITFFFFFLVTINTRTNQIVVITLNHCLGFPKTFIKITAFGISIMFCTCRDEGGNFISTAFSSLPFTLNSFDDRNHLQCIKITNIIV